MPRVTIHKDLKGGVPGSLSLVGSLWRGAVPDDLLGPQVAPTMSLQVIGPPSAGSKVVLWAESRLPRQTWSINDLGHICSQMFEGRILDVKGKVGMCVGEGTCGQGSPQLALTTYLPISCSSPGGRGYDRDHVVLWEPIKDRASQIWTVHVL